MLAALNALHRAKIVHGDIKPSNIMLKRTGNAKNHRIGSAFDLMDVPHRGLISPRTPRRKFSKGPSRPNAPTSAAWATC